MRTETYDDGMAVWPEYDDAPGLSFLLQHLPASADPRLVLLVLTVRLGANPDDGTAVGGAFQVAVHSFQPADRGPYTLDVVHPYTFGGNVMVLDRDGNGVALEIEGLFTRDHRAMANDG